MSKLTKRQKVIKELFTEKKDYELKEAVSILKKVPEVKFDQTVEVAMKLDLEQSSNPIRGTVSMPPGILKALP